LSSKTSNGKKLGLIVSSDGTFSVELLRSISNTEATVGSLYQVLDNNHFYYLLDFVTSGNSLEDRKGGKLVGSGGGDELAGTVTMTVGLLVATVIGLDSSFLIEESVGNVPSVLCLTW
jgi:hypothetical protein